MHWGTASKKAKPSSLEDEKYIITVDSINMTEDGKMNTL